jgi:uncharacterized protein YjbI with pentapeptide repeats
MDFLRWLTDSIHIDTVAPDSHSDTCAWRAPPDASYDVYDCPLDAWSDSTEEYCLLHGNPTDGKKLRDEVRAAFEELIMDRAEAAELDLRGLSDGSTLDLSDIEIYDSDFGDATLQGANLQTKFENVDFTGADLSNADCRAALFRGCTLDDTTLRKTDFRKGKTTCYNTSFVGASCTSTRFQGTTLRKADFTDATLKKTKLAGAQCENADFIRADISDGSFQGANCSKADFTGATIRKSKFQGTKLDDACFNDTRIIKGRYWGANLDSATFSGSTISDTSFVRADLQSASFVDAVIGGTTSFREADLEGLNLSTVRLGGDVYFGARLLQEYNADYRAGFQRVWNHICGNVTVPEFSTGQEYVLATDGGVSDPTSIEGTEEDDENSKNDESLLSLTESGEWEDLPNCIQLTPPESSLESLHDRQCWVRISSRWYWYAATVFPGLLLKNSEKTDDLYAEAESLYGAIESGYAVTAWGRERRRFNIRQNAARQKQLSLGYVRQQLLKRTMLYGESPAQVLRFAGLITVLAAIIWSLFGVKIDGQSIHLGYPSDGVIKAGGYSLRIAEHGIRQLIGIGSTRVAPQGLIGKWVETTVAVVGKLLFAMFVYTLGRHATT